MNMFLEYIFLSHVGDKYFWLTDILDVVHNHKVFTGTNLFCM